jgi:hypothetical protein
MLAKMLQYELLVSHELFINADGRLAAFRPHSGEVAIGSEEAGHVIAAQGLPAPIDTERVTKKERWPGGFLWYSTREYIEVAFAIPAFMPKLFHSDEGTTFAL